MISNWTDPSSPDELALVLCGRMRIHLIIWPDGGSLQQCSPARTSVFKFKWIHLIIWPDGGSLQQCSPARTSVFRFRRTKGIQRMFQMADTATARAAIGDGCAATGAPMRCQWEGPGCDRQARRGHGGVAIGSQRRGRGFEFRITVQGEHTQMEGSLHAWLPDRRHEVSVGACGRGWPGKVDTSNLGPWIWVSIERGCSG
jgi:hypothetical protein